MTRHLPILLSALLGTTAASHAADAAAWWNKEWTQRNLFTLDTGGDGAGLTGSAGSATVLVRLHDGNFAFTAAKEDGSDLRFIAADGKSELAYQIESYDPLLNEAFVWVKLPEVKGGEKQAITLYYGNASAAAAGKPGDAQDGDSVLVYHFGTRGGNPADATANGNNSTTPATIAEGSLIGNGLRLNGAAPLVIPASPSLEWQAGQSLTVSTWVKPTGQQPNAVLLSRGGFRLLLDNGVPLIEINGARSAAGAPLAAGSWSHLALVANGGNLQLFVNGEVAGSLAAALPAANTPILLGGLAADAPAGNTTGYIGEFDEFQISRVARSADWVRLAFVGQGATPASQKTLVSGAPEGGEAKGGSHLLEHLSLFGDIAGNMMFDGWIAIGICVIMIGVGWTVAVRKFLYLNTVEKGNAEFLRRWKALSSDLTAIDHTDEGSIRSLGGNVDATAQAAVDKSPLYHIYHIGSGEIRHRLAKDSTRTQGLSGRSIQAIRAALDSGLVHETHRLTKGLVYLTISIAGGPYVGLLGTVVGVMITFAIIARSGEVNVNSIAPGIASALLATVVGLVVAIPALFIYSYLNSRIKDALGISQVFIDEFVAKMAEFYPPAGENSPYAAKAVDQSFKS